MIPSRARRLKSEKLVLSLGDGDRLLIRFAAGDSDVVVYLWHGLGGHCHADYMRRTARIAHRMGHSVYMANHRGCGEGADLASLPYHSGRWQDIEALLKLGKKRHPEKRHLVVGFSLSGNALLLLLGQAKAVKPDFAVAVNAPIDLAQAADRISSGFPNRLYDLRFVLRIRKSVKRRQRSGIMPGHYRIPFFATLKQVDDLLTAPACGFLNKEDYYRRCSTHQRLSLIDIPTVLIAAKDDPMVPFGAYQEADLSPQTILQAESCGGHMGYLTTHGSAYRWDRWLDHALQRSFTHLLSSGAGNRTGTISEPESRF